MSKVFIRGRFGGLEEVPLADACEPEGFYDEPQANVNKKALGRLIAMLVSKDELTLEEAAFIAGREIFETRLF